MTALESSYSAEVVRLVESSVELMRALRCVRGLGLASWCIGAGVVRNHVWDALHGRPSVHDSDVDVVYFDAHSAAERDAELQSRLCSLMPDVEWEVTNQAHVHRWFEREHGRNVAPLGSLEEGVSTWPEFATCVGVYLTQDDAVQVVAPHGLADLFELRVRRNPARASIDEFRQRVRTRRFLERWPRLALVQS